MVVATPSYLHSDIVGARIRTIACRSSHLYLHRRYERESRTETGVTFARKYACLQYWNPNSMKFSTIDFPIGRIFKHGDNMTTMITKLC